MRHRKWNGPRIKPEVVCLSLPPLQLMHSDEIETLEWWRSGEAVWSLFNNHGVSSCVFCPDTYSLQADRLKDVSKSLLSPSGLLAAGTSHTSVSVSLSPVVQIRFLLCSPRAADVPPSIGLCAWLFVPFVCLVLHLISADWRALV